MTVLLAYIHTPEGDAALNVAIRETAWRATDAVVVNVTRPAAAIDAPMSAEQALDAVATVFRRAGLQVEVRQLPASPDRAGAILTLMSELRPDLAVIGMRRHRPIGDRVTGSTSLRILRGAECPVLVVKAPTS